MSSFASRLLSWFEAHGRHDLPWQQPRDAYRVWVSEIMLQQTQVQTVIPYFERFMASFPDARTLADATLDAVLHHWSGLGYYARARNLHRAARQVRDEHAGVFPRAFDDVLALPGIGRSTAGAILAQAYGDRHPILDGNAKRVLARHGAIAGWPGTTAVARRLWEAAERHTPKQDVAAYTQAIMDLGATLCARSSPGCERCPVRSDCAALAEGTVADYPGRKPRRARPQRATTMLIARHDDRVCLERRPEAGIWGGLWSLPELGDESAEAWCDRQLQAGVSNSASMPSLRHSFSHYDLEIRPLVVCVESPSSKVADADDMVWYRLGTAPPGGLAAPVIKLIEQLKKSTNVTQD